ncbi:SNF2 family N-terminal domain-containing protein [Trichoderma austrokoningii]
MSASLGYSAGHIIESDAQLDGHSTQKSQYGSLKEIVCFGEIIGILAKCGSGTGVPDANSTSFRARLESCEKFASIDNDSINGTIDPDYTHLTDLLRNEVELDLQIMCTFDFSRPSGAGKRAASRLPKYTIPCTISIIIYGPFEMLADIGNFFQTCEIYLQDPSDCDRNVRYCNPHRLSSTNLDACSWTSELKANQTNVIEIKPISPLPELLDIIESTVKLPEAIQPDAIRTTLERHQRQALTFMHRRELGWALDGSRPDLWEYMENGQRHWFVNHVSNAYQDEEPEEFSGGIIADPMGLGKTLTMISLVASDVQPHEPVMDVDDVTTLATTLIIVPPPLLGTWEEQLSEHVIPGYLNWCRHHGKTKLSKTMLYNGISIVLTTYHTVSAEWKSHSEHLPSILFSTRWKRVILDEAHFIRNSSSQLARATCALNAASRWAVTGTPIQNRLSDLTTLLNFLRVYPYSNRKQFDADFTNLWKEGNADEALKRLKKLAAYLILRRTQNTIQLPLRRDLQCAVEFTEGERVVYEEIRNTTIARIDDILYDSSDDARPLEYINVLQQIEAMRMVCNLGLHYHGRRKLGAVAQKKLDNWTTDAQQTFNLQGEIGGMQCRYCFAVSDTSASLLNDTQSQQPLQLSKCLQLICFDCVSMKRPIDCGHSPPCDFAGVYLNPNSLEETSLSLSLNSFERAASSSSQNLKFPPKVVALVGQLKALPPGVKSVVFSTWRTTLDIVEAGLNQASVECLRFDGGIPLKERQTVIDRFRQDSTPSVLLLTLSCGAVGLTLTVASYAFLMEPHWNPTLEDQALARIYRLGQRNEVTTIRFYVRDSFEQRVMDVQKSKREMAAVLLQSQEPGGGTSLSTLQNLRSLL